MAKTNVTFTNFAAKKLLGKTQTRPKLTDAEEAFPSNVSVPGAGVFAESIPSEPGTDYFTLYSASAGAPATVEKVYFDLVGIADSIYDGGLEDSEEGGDSAQGSTTHAYYLKLPSNYETTSSNPNRGSGNFVNDKRLYLSRGGLQLVPPFTTDAGLPGASGVNRYFVEIFTGDPTNPLNKISETSAIDWQFDYYSGILFIQDSASVAPVTASAYLYVGKYLDEKISDLSSSSGGLSDVVSDTTPQLGGNLDVNGKDITSVSNGDIEFDPNGSGKVVFKGNATKGSGQFVLNCENNSHGIIIKGPPHSAGASYTITLPNNDGDADQFLKTNGSGVTSWADAISYSRTAVTTTITASTSARIMGVSASAALEIRLPAASGYSAGQNFIVKDEAGNANINNITILTTGGETIDGSTSIILESPHAAVNIYSDGTSKFFIY